MARRTAASALAAGLLLALSLATLASAATPTGLAADSASGGGQAVYRHAGGLPLSTLADVRAALARISAGAGALPVWIHITGTLSVSGAELTDADVAPLLERVSSVRALKLRNTRGITSLDMLGNLQRVEASVLVADNAGLRSMCGLGLPRAAIGSFVSVYGNPGLKAFPDALGSGAGLRSTGAGVGAGRCRRVERESHEQAAPAPAASGKVRAG